MFYDWNILWKIRYTSKVPYKYIHISDDEKFNVDLKSDQKKKKNNFFFVWVSVRDLTQFYTI
jgi:hypothetical protein